VSAAIAFGDPALDSAKPSEILQGAIAWRLVCFAPSAALALDPRASLDYARSRDDDGSGAAVRVIRLTVYILASRRNGTLYVGVTGDLASRISIHGQDLVDGFTKQYGVHLLVYYEHFETMNDAIAREKTLKKLSRAAKIRLIETGNQEWRDLALEIQAWRQ
jgi:putative endonuclease